MYMKMNMEMLEKSYRKQFTPTAYRQIHSEQQGLCSICHLPADHEGLGGRYFPEHDDYLEVCHWRCNPNNPKAAAVPDSFDMAEEPPVKGDFLKAFQTMKKGTYPISYQRRKNYYKETLEKT